jgi:hypothetical protein
LTAPTTSNCCGVAVTRTPTMVLLALHFAGCRRHFRHQDHCMYFEFALTRVSSAAIIAPHFDAIRAVSVNSSQRK